MDDNTATLAGGLSSAFEALAGIDQSVLDAIPSAVYVCAADGVIVRYNRCAAELWGRAPRLGDTDQRLCGAFRLYRRDGTPLPHAATPMATALETGEPQQDQEVEIERPDGSRVIVQVNIEPLKDSAGRVHGAVNCFHDVTARKRGESDHYRLAAIVETSHDAIVSKSLDGIVQSWNGGAERLFGYTEEEVVGQSITIIIPPDKLDEEKTILSRIRRGERVAHYETVRRRKDGSLIDVSLAVSPVTDDAGRVIGASKIARDISVRKRQEQALAQHAQEQTALYRFVDQLQHAATPEAIYEAALQAICSAFDCRRASILRFDGEGVMRFVAWRGLSDGYRQAAEGHSPWRSGDRDAVPTTVEDIDATDEPEELKAAIRGEGIRGLAFIPLFAAGEVVGKFMIYHEEPHVFGDHEIELAVTIARQLGFSLERHWAEEGRRRVEEELRQNQERFRLAIEAAPSGMLQVDQEGRIHLVNAHAEALLGYDRSELIGRKVEMLVPERFRGTHPAFRETFGAAPEARPMGAGRELYALRKDGSEVPVEIGLSPVRTSEGLFVLSAIVDISERKRAEAQRELLLAELNHRVKNTLAVVQGIAYQTFKDTDTSPAVLKAFEGRLGALARAHGLLTQSSWENASLDDLVAEALSVAGADERRVDVDGPPVLLDPRPALAVAIALHELCTNALKYGALSVEGGRIAVEWEAAGPMGDGLRLTWQESGGPRVSPPAHRGFGTRMIEGALAHDLGGTVRLEFRPDGLRCIIEAPLREGEAA